MTSVIFTRRAMLSSGTLMGLSTLLAACGQQAANEAGASASSTAAPSETASASATESPFCLGNSVYCPRLFGRLEGTRWGVP